MLEPVILNYCRGNPSFFLKVKDYLSTTGKKSYFSDDKYQEVFNLYGKFYDKFNKPPKRESLKAILDRKYHDEEEIRTYFFSIVDTMYDKKMEYDEEYIEEEIKTFIQENRVYEAWFEGQGDVEKGDYGALLSKVESAVRVNFDKDLGTSIKDVDFMYDQIQKVMSEDVIDTGFNHLNSIIDGGFHDKEIYCLSAIPGGFKCLHSDVKIKIKYNNKNNTIIKELPIGKLFDILGYKDQGEHKAPESLEVNTKNGYKKVEGLLKTQPNEEWEVITNTGRSAIFADFHKLASPQGKIYDEGVLWSYVKDIQVGHRVYTDKGMEEVSSVEYLNKKSEMYDLQVVGKQFYANGFVSHNTGFIGNFAVNSFLEGKNVLVYSFETSRERLAMRYYANLVRMNKKEMLFDEENFKDKVKEAVSNMEGDLILKEYNANTVCANDLLAHIADLKRYKDWEPDIIFIDYLLIMLTNDKKMSSENGFKYYKTVTEEVRNIAKTLNIPVMTATQINREGMSDRGGSKSLVTAKNIAESRGIYDTVDFFAIITQTAKEKEKNKYYLYVDKNRNDRTGIKIEYEVNYEHMTLEEKAIY